MIKSYKKILATLFLALIVCLFIVYVWPTKYQYFEIGSGGYGTLVQINRLSGETHVLRVSGDVRWKRVDDLDRLIDQLPGPREED
jgi:hypothetical protein